MEKKERKRDKKGGRKVWKGRKKEKRKEGMGKEGKGKVMEM